MLSSFFINVKYFIENSRTTDINSTCPLRMDLLDALNQFSSIVHLYHCHGPNETHELIVKLIQIKSITRNQLGNCIAVILRMHSSAHVIE